MLFGKPPAYGSARLGHIPSLPGESQLPLKPCISLQPSDFEGNCDSISIFLRFPLRFIKTFVKEGSLPSLTIHLAELSQLDRSCLRLVSCNLSESQTKNGLASSSASPFFQPLIEQLFFFQSYYLQLQSIPALPEQFLQPIQHGYNDIKPPSLLHKLPAL